MSITAKLASERSAFNASMTTSKGIIEASITEEIGAFNAFINTSTRIPDHLLIEGTWAGPCLCGHNVSENIAGLSFKCVYRNGSYIYVTPTYTPTVWQDTEGEQTVKFTYTEDGIVLTASITANVIRQPISLTVTGSWTNEQNVGSVVDTTGLVFTVTYHDGTTKVVEPVVTPETWTESGLQTATFTYTEHGFVVSAEKSVEVYAVLVSLVVTGTWENEQSVGSAPDLTGLVFTAYFNDSSSQTILHSAIVVSPSAWGSSGTQTATFGYTYRGVTKTTSKDAEVVASYTEVEYLEATGTQYINTGLLSTRDSTVDIVFGFTSMASGVAENCAVFGGRNNTTSNTFTFFKLASGSPQYFRFDYNGQTTVSTANYMTWNTDSVYRFTYNGTHTNVTNLMSGQSVSAALSPASSFTTTPIALFAVNTNNSVGTFMKGRIYKYKYSNGVTTIDLIPVLDYNGRPAMYDKISGQFFYNQGTGEFIVGKEIRSATYIESTGTQYIDTGVRLSDSYTVELDYQLTEALQSRTGLFGALNMTGGNQGRFGSILSPSNKYLEHGYGASNIYWQQGLPDTNRHLFRQEQNKVYYDGTLLHTFDSASFTLAITAYLGNFVFTNYTPAKAKYYASKWYDGTTLVRDYIPAQDENGIGFWFDRVSHVCYLNKGAGEFLVDADSRLPQEYQGVAYLESTGTQWINTGNPIVTSTDEVELLYRLMSGTQYKWLMGEHDNNARFGLGSGDGAGKRNIAYGSNTNKAADSYFLDSQHYFKANASGVFIDGTKMVNYASFSSGSTIYLFNLNLNESNYCAESRIWRFRHKRNGVLIRDLVPCYRKADNVAGMYDLVNNTFLINSGTGTFITGQET